MDGKMSATNIAASTKMDSMSNITARLPYREIEKALAFSLAR
jgi:hypothetical protein